MSTLPASRARDMVAVRTPKCVVCGKRSVIQVPREGLDMLNRDRMLIQQALPLMSPEDREMMISGTHPACWDQMLDFDDDEEEL